MLRNIARLTIAATLLGSASVAMAAPRNNDESAFRAVYQQNAASQQRTSGYTGPGAGSANPSQLDRTATTEQ